MKTLLCLGASLTLLGCANRSSDRFDKIARAAGKQDFLGAAASIRKHPELYGSQSRLLWEMDLGILYHYAGLYDSSIAHLAKAVSIHDDLFARSVSNEAAALLTNDNVRPYRGMPHEIVMLRQFLAFDYLALGRYEDALVEARQTQLYLDELKRKAGSDGKAYSDDGMFRYLTALIYEAARDQDDAAISLYRAVKAYRQGPVALPAGVAAQAYATLSAQDRRDDIQELKLEAPSGRTGAAPPAPGSGQAEIVVVGHAGRSPSLDQTAFWGTWVRDGILVIHYRNAQGEEITQALPAPGLPPRELEKASKGRRTRSGTTFHIKFALPALKPMRSRTRFFSVTGDSAPQPVRSEALTDLDPLLAGYLEASKSATLTRTVVRVVLRTIAAEKTKSAMNTENPLANLILNIFTDVLADQLEQADTRSCFLLPRTIQVARIPVQPGMHTVTVQAHDEAGGIVGTQTFERLDVKPGQKKFVFYASPL